MSVLILAPHADDEVLGAGATISKLVSNGEKVTVAVLTGHGPDKHPIWPESAWATIREECQQACKVMGVDDLRFRELPAACLDNLPNWKINSEVQSIIEEVNPDQLYIPFANDLHKDHGAIAYAVTVATRPYLALGKQVKRVIAYETLSETHLAPGYLEPAFQPNLFVDVSDFLHLKVKAFQEYKSQIQPDNMPRSIRSIESLAHLRGSHIGVDAAEAFIILRELQ